MVFVNRIVRGILGPKRDENEGWRRLHNEKLNSLYRSPNIIKVIKTRILIWEGHIARMEEVGIFLKFQQENLQDRDL